MPGDKGTIDVLLMSMKDSLCQMSRRILWSMEWQCVMVS